MAQDTGRMTVYLMDMTKLDYVLPYETSELIPLMPQKRVEQYARLKNEKAKRECLAGGLLLTTAAFLFEKNKTNKDHLVNESCQTADNGEIIYKMIFSEHDRRKIVSEIKNGFWDEHTYQLSSYGKPQIRGMEVSLSHAGDYAVCAVSNQPVGIDIERVRIMNKSLTQKACTKKEQEYIENSETIEERKRRFVEIWTNKEAYLKYTGTGIRLPLTSIEVLGEDVYLTEEQIYLSEIGFWNTWLPRDEYHVSICGEKAHTYGLRIQEIE